MDDQQVEGLYGLAFCSVAIPLLVALALGDWTLSEFLILGTTGLFLLWGVLQVICALLYSDNAKKPKRGRGRRRRNKP